MDTSQVNLNPDSKKLIDLKHNFLENPRAYLRSDKTVKCTSEAYFSAQASYVAKSCDIQNTKLQEVLIIKIFLAFMLSMSWIPRTCCSGIPRHYCIVNVLVCTVLFSKLHRLYPEFILPLVIY